MLAILLALLIGISLGLLGGGGSILTVPILVYVLKIDPKTAIALSLAIVGFSTLIGSFNNYRKQNIEYKIAMIFLICAFPATILGSFLSTKVSSNFQMLLFSIIMIITSLFMFRERKESLEEKTPNNIFIGLSSIFVGILTGLIGVGGGFLIVPALMLFANLKMKRAVGTSLMIISINSLIGFISYINILEIPWRLLNQFIFFTSIGIIIGAMFSDKISEKILKKVFAAFLVVMGFFILSKNYIN